MDDKKILTYEDISIDKKDYEYLVAFLKLSIEHSRGISGCGECSSAWIDRPDGRQSNVGFIRTHVEQRLLVFELNHSGEYTLYEDGSMVEGNQYQYQKKL